MQNWKHWRLVVESNGLGFLTFDRAKPDGSPDSTNTFSSEALRELGAVCTHLAANPVKGLAIQSAKDNGFAAGADIDEFTSFKSVEEAVAMTKLGLDVFDQVAALPFPTVAMIHGFCMGGGTELALACRYRIADEGPKTKMALPEVMLGIVPGWGGGATHATPDWRGPGARANVDGTCGECKNGQTDGVGRRCYTAPPFHQCGDHAVAKTACAASTGAERRRDQLAGDSRFCGECVTQTSCEESTS